MRLWMVLMVWLLLPVVAGAVNIETLVMPGKVISGHAKYEEKCDKCHEAFSKKSQRRLCLECHETVAVEIRQKQGLHGRDVTIQTVECKQCHTDHLGRDADIMQFNADLFDHKRADFALRDSHARVTCSACHKPNKKYREAPSTCFDCHEARDVHKEGLGKECGRCHNEKSWRDTRFDHGKTRYQLTGKHQGVSCILCHPGNRYKGVPDRCGGCHQLNDIHGGRYGEKCQECHSTKGWQKYGYDHDKLTKFPLRGRHQKAQCDSCHRQDYKQKLEMECFVCHKNQDKHKTMLGKRCDGCHGEERWQEHKFKHDNFRSTPCYDCHKSDDSHRGRYGEQCQECHEVNRWNKSLFSHNKKTRFPLLGKHKDLACLVCHKGDAKKEHGKTGCYECHRLDDVHGGKEGKECQRCHNALGWREKLKFDHDMSRFPLIGLHTVVPCEGCHLNANYRETGRSCFKCHEADDEHRGRLGERCEQCHNPNSWRFWQFNHDLTKFRLKNAHKRASCDACHTSTAKGDLRLPVQCYNCHRHDDIHNGRFGHQCERCHNDNSFKEISLRQ